MITQNTCGSHLSVITVLGNKAAIEKLKIPQSSDTIHRRILEMPSDIETNVCRRYISEF